MGTCLTSRCLETSLVYSPTVIKYGNEFCPRIYVDMPLNCSWNSGNLTGNWCFDTVKHPSWLPGDVQGAEHRSVVTWPTSSWNESFCGWMGHLWKLIMRFFYSSKMLKDLYVTKYQFSSKCHLEVVKVFDLIFIWSTFKCNLWKLPTISSIDIVIWSLFVRWRILGFNDSLTFGKG
jgi:hypothetical protein